MTVDNADSTNLLDKMELKDHNFIYDHDEILDGRLGYIELLNPYNCDTIKISIETIGTFISTLPASDLKKMIAHDLKIKEERIIQEHNDYVTFLDNLD